MCILRLHAEHYFLPSSSFFNSSLSLVSTVCLHTAAIKRTSAAQKSHHSCRHRPSSPPTGACCRSAGPCSPPPSLAKISLLLHPALRKRAPRTFGRRSPQTRRPPRALPAVPAASLAAEASAVASLSLPDLLASLADEAAPDMPWGVVWVYRVRFRIPDWRRAIQGASVVRRQSRCPEHVIADSTTSLP